MRITGLFTALTDSRFLTKTDYLMRGDILVKEGSHTVIVLEDGEGITQYYPKYTGSYGWLVDALISLSIDESPQHRQIIAEKNGIQNYERTAAQNKELLALLKAGKLKRE